MFKLFTFLSVISKERGIREQFGGIQQIRFPASVSGITFDVYPARNADRGIGDGSGHAREVEMRAVLWIKTRTAFPF